MSETSSTKIQMMLEQSRSNHLDSSRAFSARSTPTQGTSNVQMDETAQMPSRTAETERSLQQLRGQYLALYPIRHVDFGSLGADPLYKHQDWIYEHLLSWKYQPAKDYQRKFLKGLIDTVEEGLRSEEAVLGEWASVDRQRSVPYR